MGRFVSAATLTHSGWLQTLPHRELRLFLSKSPSEENDSLLVITRTDYPGMTVGQSPGTGRRHCTRDKKVISYGPWFPTGHSTTLVERFGPPRKEMNLHKGQYNQDNNV
jgi:hypothetical protein